MLKTIMCYREKILISNPNILYWRFTYWLLLIFLEQKITKKVQSDCMKALVWGKGVFPTTLIVGLKLFFL